MAISDTDSTKRYRVECHVFDGMGEDDCYDIYCDTAEEAEQVAADEETDPDENGHHVAPEIVDQWGNA